LTIFSGKENKNVVAVEKPKTYLRKLPDLDQPKEKTKLIAQDIYQALGDKHSQGFYYLVAAKVPEGKIHATLSSIKHSGARSPAKVFASRMKEYAAEHTSARTQSLSLSL